jgi:hypothetical protein
VGTHRWAMHACGLGEMLVGAHGGSLACMHADGQFTVDCVSAPGTHGPAGYERCCESSSMIVHCPVRSVSRGVRADATRSQSYKRSFQEIPCAITFSSLFQTLVALVWVSCSAFHAYGDHVETWHANVHHVVVVTSTLWPAYACSPCARSRCIQDRSGNCLRMASWTCKALLARVNCACESPRLCRNACAAKDLWCWRVPPQAVRHCAS